MNTSRDTDSEFVENLKERIKALFSAGVDEYQGVLSALGGADPRQVFELWSDVSGQTRRSVAVTGWSTPGIGGSLLPIEDPSRGQWWFTPYTTEWLARLVTQCSPPDVSGADGWDVLALGTPTLALALGGTGRRVCCLDADPDVIEAVRRLAPPETTEANIYDVADELPSDVTHRRATCVVLDPPWYDPTMEAFIGRALQACRIPGHLILTLPSRFTRPDAEVGKQELIRRLTAAGLQVRLYAREQLEFVVPVFERRAFQDLAVFRGTPWRRADVLHLAIEDDGWSNHLRVPECHRSVTQIVSRDPRYFRVFVATNDALKGDAAAQPVFNPYERYRTNISRRSLESSKYNIWTSDRRAGKVSNLGAALEVLEAWRNPDLNQHDSRETAILAIVNKGMPRDVAEAFVRAIDEELQLWARFHYPSRRRTDIQIVEFKNRVTSELGIAETAEDARQIGRSYREHRAPSDTFRPEYQRDRDRALWSKSVRRLANKTQLFPMERSDQLRQRLAHSLEVMQLATTITEAFGLNRDLVEAGALAHDIGHTPFGHAGEHALDELLQELNSKLGGFNHYEHGVDVVRYLEDPYQSRSGTGHLGLNLTSAVCECILKHTFCHVEGKWKRDRESVWEATKHRDFIMRGNAHLEGQAVRIADKISYLISDVEDGILLGAVRREHLIACRLFHYAPIDFRASGSPDDLHGEFVVQRRNLIQVLMEDVIVASEARMARLPLGRDVRSDENFVVDHSEEMRLAVEEVWNGIQSIRLHQDARVIMANMRAAKIVKELTVLFAIFPNLIDMRFEGSYRRVRNSQYMKWYRERSGSKVRVPDRYTDFLPLHWLIGVDPKQIREFDVELLVQSKDYVASLTDSEAKRLHHQFISSYADH